MLETLKYLIVHNTMAALVLALIYCGVITKPSEIIADVDETYMNRLAAVIDLENSCGDDECQLLTGSVPINRMNSKNWKGDTLEEIILAKGQYASKTRNNFKTHNAPEHTKLLAKYLIVYGPICPKNVVYQGMSRNGSGVYKSLKVKGQSKPELFCYE